MGVHNYLEIDNNQYVANVTGGSFNSPKGCIYYESELTCHNGTVDYAEEFADSPGTVLSKIEPIDNLGCHTNFVIEAVIGGELVTRKFPCE